MEWFGAVVALVLWFVGVPLVAVAVLRLLRYDFNKPWMMWRSQAGPLPLWIYVGVSLVLLVGVFLSTR